ncbi:MAG: phosphomannomutase/phosphoglucomutase [Actinobacteria bacterium]|nr:phosphomannomutase/phosphoglucomutase [Actinomycetota bacterium]
MSPIKASSPQQRQCPGDNCDIAEHICRARQNRGYPPCKECDWGGGMGKTKALAKSEEDQLAAVLNKIVKAYDIRGRYPEQVNEDIAWRLGYATADYLRSEVSGYARSERSSKSMVVGRDMRIGSPELAAAFIKGALCSGVNCIDIGMIDSPLLYFAINHLNACGGAQITASHNPAGDNGFKIAGQKARPVGGETGLDKIKALASAARRGVVRNRLRGKLSRRHLTAAYKKHVLKFAGPISPLRVVVDASNGMAGRFIPKLFDDLPIKIVPLNFKHDGRFVHPPNPLVEENLAELKKTVRRRKAHLGVCFDGDADRCIFVDEKGQAVEPDLVTAVLAKEFLAANPGSTIVYDLRSSHVVPETIVKLDGLPRRERVGHAFMKHAMADSGAAFGGELSGHYYYRDNWFCDSGFITFVVMLTALSKAGTPLSKLIKTVKKYHHSGEINFEVHNKAAVLDKIIARYRKNAKARIDMRDGVTVELDNYWFNVRPSNTESKLRLNLEANSKAMMERMVRDLTKLISSPAKASAAGSGPRRRR